MSGIDQQLRGSLLIALLRRGVDEDDATFATYAVHPFDSDVPPASKDLERRIRKRARRLAKSLGRAPVGRVAQLAIEALEAHKRDAVLHDDRFYAGRFSGLLDTLDDRESDTQPGASMRTASASGPSETITTRNWSPDSLFEAFVIRSSPGEGPDGPRANEIGVICSALLSAGFEKLGLAEVGTADEIYESQDSEPFSDFSHGVRAHLSEAQNYDEVLLATVLQLSIANATNTAARAANEHPDVDPAVLVSWEALCWGLRKLLVACNEVDQSWKFRDQGLVQTLIEEGFDWLASTLPEDTLSTLSPRVRGEEFDYPETFDATFWPSWLTHRLACRASQEGTPLNDLDLEVLGDSERRGALPVHLAELMHRAYEDDRNGTGMSPDPRWWELARAGTAY